jgi:trehalose/maltose hydrolase-like predicted phosphorylase
MNNDKYINTLIEVLIQQRNEALNQVAQLKTQLQITSEELNSIKNQEQE